MYIAIADSIRVLRNKSYLSGKYVFQSGVRNVDADDGQLYKKDLYDSRSTRYDLEYTDGVWQLCDTTYTVKGNAVFRLSSKGKHYEIMGVI